LPPPEGLPGFKRTFAISGVVFVALELLLVGWAPMQLLDLAPLEHSLVARAALPVLLAAQAIWVAATASWLSPVQRVITARRKAQPVEAATAAAAYRMLGRLPLRALILRLALWTAVGGAMALLLMRRAATPLPRAAALVAMIMLHAFVLAGIRGAWLGDRTARWRAALFPGVEPLAIFGDHYFRRLAVTGLLIGGVAVGALAAVIHFFMPIRAEEYLDVVTLLPPLVLIAGVAWLVWAHRQRRPIDAYLRSQREGAENRFRSAPDAAALVAYARGQSLPYRLAGGRALAWLGVAAVVAMLARTSFRLEIDNAILIFAAGAVIVVGAGLYEATWYRTIMRPLLAHLGARHRLPVRDIPAALSLRGKLLLSFGGLVLFACGLSLFWGFVQYKSLVTSFGQTQAQLNLGRLSSEAQVRLTAAKGKSGVKTMEVLTALVDEAGGGSAADGAVYYFIPDSSTFETHGAGGGQMGAPRLPWYALLRVRSARSGAIELPSLGLAGAFHALLAGPSGQRLGALAVMYPGYRGRGPGVQRPLKELLIFFLMLFGVCGGLVWLTVGEFTMPIRSLEKRAHEMARGELSRTVTAGAESDEVGRLTFALEEMRRALREKLRSTEEVNLDLEREVQRRTADLARKNRELADALEKLTRAQSQLVRAEKMASIGQLVAGIAHEINNPVNAIANTAGPLGEVVDDVTSAATVEARSEVAAEIRDMVRVIQNGARRTKEIVQALHNYSRTDDEKLADFDLNRGLDDSLELLRHLLRGGIAVEKHFGEVGKIRGHAGQINQVFMNLLTNAAQALAGQPGARISLASARRGDLVVITVVDNGAGIPPEILPKIFDPFFTTKDVGQGTGLGLSIVHGIVERHGGTIEVESEVSRGTTFTVTLPVRPPG
jgi:signal transduction histidine kinase